MKQGTNHKDGVAITIPNYDPNLIHYPSSLERNVANPSLIYVIIKWFDLELLLLTFTLLQGQQQAEQLSLSLYRKL